MTKYIYTLHAPVKRPDAQGLGDHHDFIVMLDTPTATFCQVVEGFHNQYPPADICYWQPRAVITVGGVETFNCGDRLFEAERSIDDEGHDRMVRLAAER